MGSFVADSGALGGSGPKSEVVASIRKRNVMPYGEDDEDEEPCFSDRRMSMKEVALVDCTPLGAADASRISRSDRSNRAMV
jgi:hypothetical protein